VLGHVEQVCSDTMGGGKKGVQKYSNCPRLLNVAQSRDRQENDHSKPRRSVPLPETGPRKGEVWPSDAKSLLWGFENQRAEFAPKRRPEEDSSERSAIIIGQKCSRNRKTCRPPGSCPGGDTKTKGESERRSMDKSNPIGNSQTQRHKCSHISGGKRVQEVLGAF